MRLWNVLANALTKRISCDIIIMSNHDLSNFNYSIKGDALCLSDAKVSCNTSMTPTVPTKPNSLFYTADGGLEKPNCSTSSAKIKPPSFTPAANTPTQSSFNLSLIKCIATTYPPLNMSIAFPVGKRRSLLFFMFRLPAKSY